MNLTPEDLQYIAQGRVSKRYNAKLRWISFAALFLVFFLLATELWALFYTAAGLWTTFFIIMLVRMHQTEKAMLNGLLKDYDGKEV